MCAPIVFVAFDVGSFSDTDKVHYEHFCMVGTYIGRSTYLPLKERAEEGRQIGPNYLGVDQERVLLFLLRVKEAFCRRPHSGPIEL